MHVTAEPAYAIHLSERDAQVLMNILNQFEVVNETPAGDEAELLLSEMFEGLSAHGLEDDRAVLVLKLIHVC